MKSAEHLPVWPIARRGGGLFAIAIGLLLSTVAAGALASSSLTRDYREALEQGCRRQSAGNLPAYHACIQDALDQLERGRKLAGTDALGSAVRDQIRLACIGKKELGLFEYDDCIRSQRAQEPQPGGRVSEPHHAPEAPRRAEADGAHRDAGEALDPAQLFELASISVYFVRSHSNGSVLLSIGSAVAISDTLLLTNCHVVAQAQEVLISETDGAPWTAALRYADRKTDRCVIESTRRVVPTKAIRRYAELKIGERVYTIGNPSGFTRTLAEGLISGLRQRDGVRLVQTSAAISPGSSGGGLFDSRGRLVGITTFIIGEQSLLGFAIAADDFTSLLPTRR